MEPPAEDGAGPPLSLDDLVFLPLGQVMFGLPPPEVDAAGGLVGLPSGFLPWLESGAVTATDHVLSEAGERSIACRLVREGDAPVCCPILLTDVEAGGELAKLPCGHEFEKAALLYWLKEKSASCPTCRAPLPSDELPEQPTTDGTFEAMMEELFGRATQHMEDQALQRAIEASLSQTD